MKKNVCILIAVLFSINGLRAQTITVIKHSSSNQSKSYSHRVMNKHTYVLHCSDENNSCHWQHASERINGYLPQDVNNWVMQEIQNGKTKGKTMYQSSVYVKWHARKNKHTIKMSSKIL